MTPKWRTNHPQSKPKVNQVANQARRTRQHRKKATITNPNISMVIRDDSVCQILCFVRLDAGDDEHADKESHSPSKKAKGKPGRKPGQTTKGAASKDHDQEVDHDHGKSSPRGFCRQTSMGASLEMQDESDASASTGKKSNARKGHASGSSKKSSGNAENDDDSMDEDLDLSEGETPSSGKKTAASTKKGPTKRSAPSSGQKTGAKTGKKRSADDEPFEDRTNDDESIDDEDNSDDGQCRAFSHHLSHSFVFFFTDGPPAKQQKRGRAGNKAPSSGSKGNSRAAKKTKTS